MRSSVCVVVLGLLARTAAAQPEPDPLIESGAHDEPGTDDDRVDEPAGVPVLPPPEPPPVPRAKRDPITTTLIKAEPQAAPRPPDGFRFGSYGRVLAGTDLRGGKPESANVVAHGPRVVEKSYLELDFSYGFDSPSGKRLRPVMTLAFDSTLFHETGNFDAQPALRNVFLEAELTDNLLGWAGSRMYRGDDIYLLDYWPLDDLNTVGAGLLYRQAAVEVAVHAGVNRLEEPSEFQFQEIDVQDPAQGARTIVQLNRQRMITSATAAYRIGTDLSEPNYKIKVHGEAHVLPSGRRQLDDDGVFEDLPFDTGYLVGVQFGTFGYAAPELRYRRHVNVFARYARGLAAFDELAPPTSFDLDLKARRASELSFGVSGNWDVPYGNVMFGFLSRRFVDADRDTVDFDDGWEYAAVVRPLGRIAGDIFGGMDLSYQARFPRGLNPSTLRAEDPAVFQFAPMLVYSPMGPSGYDRPQIRLVYRGARLNKGARELFVPDDPRFDYTWTHFLGVQVEWWFNSNTYQR
jgi:hypothetical protein